MEKDRTLWEVAVLALLREAPMHPYQMQRLLQQRHKNELLALKRGSLYHAINRLMRAGLIATVATGRSGRRPERTTYRITREGRQELTRALRQMVGVPRHESSDFMAAMSFLPHLEPKDAIVRLEERARRLKEEVREIEVRLKSAMEHVPRIHLIESEYFLTMRRAELRWVRDVLGDLRSRRLIWDIKRMILDVQAARKAAAAPEEGK